MEIVPAEKGAKSSLKPAVSQRLWLGRMRDLR